MYNKNVRQRGRCHINYNLYLMSKNNFDKLVNRYNKALSADIAKKKLQAQRGAMQYKCKHPFHMVKSSPWPFVTSQTLFIFILTLVNFLHYTIYSALAVFVSFGVFLLPIFF